MKTLTYFMFALCLALSIVLETSSSLKADEKKTIHWLKWELSPEFIRHGEFAGKGFADQFVKFFEEKLPEYNHEMQWVSIRRWHKETLKERRCTPHIWNEFHLDQLAYSKAYMLTPPQMALFHKRHMKQLGPEGTVLSFKRLLEEKFTLLTPTLDPKQVRYPILQKYIEPYTGSERVIEIGTANEIDLRLIERKRGDFTLGYPTVITSQRRDRGLRDNFIGYHLEEHQQYKSIHVSCFGDETGKKVIARINQLMGQEELLYFLSLYEDWNNKDPAFRKAFNERIIDQKSSTNPIGADKVKNGS